MKTAKRYLPVFLSLVMAAPLFTGCNNGLDEYPSDAPIPAPSDKFTTTVQFVSSLDGNAFGSDYTAFNDYLTGLGDEKPWMTVLDRADNGNLPGALTGAFDATRWTAFAFNKIENRTSYQGSMLYFNSCITGATGRPSGEGCYVTQVKTALNGVRTDKDENGEVTGQTDVSFDVDFLTARFETAEQLSAFGGKNGVLRAFYAESMPVLMIGTVKNDLLQQLKSAAESASGSYAFKVYEVAAGSQYTLFLLTEERFWGLMEPVNAQPLAGNVKIYNIGVMW